MKLIAITALCLSTVVSGLLLNGYYNTFGAITLGPVKWKHVSGNDTVLIYSDADIIVGPGNLSINAKYPYIFGSCVLAKDRKSHFRFIVNVEKGTIIDSTLNAYYKEEKTLKSLGIKIDQLMTFFSLRGQWGDGEKLKEMQKSMESMNNE